MLEVKDSSFEAEVLNSELPVIVDFWAPWCGPCKVLGPTFEEVSKQYEGVAKFVKVNVDETAIAGKYGVRGIPTLIMFKGGAVAGTLVGNQSKVQIAQLVDDNI